MKTEHYKEFLSRFDGLIDAGIIMLGNYPNEIKENSLNTIEQKLKLFESFDNIFPEEVIDEINENLFDLKNSEPYLKQIIRDFKDISPHLCIMIHKEYATTSFGKEGVKIGNITYSDIFASTQKTLERYCCWIEPNLEFKIASNTEKYIILCFEAYKNFFIRLDALCLDHEIDLPAIQNKMNLQVWKRDESILCALDYFPKPKQQEETQLETEPTSEPEQNPINESRTKQLINDRFEKMDTEGWKYSFRSEAEYCLFVNLLTNFFEYKEHKLPETVIKLKSTCKTRLAKALNEIHKELSEKTLASDTEFFNIVRCLNHFATDNNLYKTITR